MQYMALPLQQREALLQALEDMPVYLETELRWLSAEQLRQRASDGSFSPLEQVWHLADLEREGFEFRIDRLLSEPAPQLPDFDGAAIAAARCYRELSLSVGLDAFRAARRRNLTKLRAIATQDWGRSGQQQGVGRVSLCDMPGFMSQHDAAHRAEISAWKAQFAG